MNKVIDHTFNYLRFALLGIAMAFLIVPYMQAQNREDSTDTQEISVIHMGDCSTSWFIPNWLGVLISFWTDENQNFEHEDVFKERYVCTKQGNNISLPILGAHKERVQRGFFATFMDQEKWYISMLSYFCCDLIVYVDSEMRDDGTGGFCSTKHIFVDPSDPFFETFIGKFMKVLFAYYRFEISWAGTYHLFERNCQHWAHFVLTGEDTSR